MRVTIGELREMKQRGEKIPMLTCYDYPSARLLDGAGVPMLLVGDSLGQVVLGYESTVRVTMEEMLHHTKAVVRGSERALIVFDLPFMTYQASAEDALRNAGRALQEGGAQAVKLEGGVVMAETVRRIVSVGIPVMGHIGLTPQSVYQLSGYKVQGRTPEAAATLYEDAIALEEAGAFAVVLESVPTPLAKRISERLTVPTIGIGAGPYCDGQVQVISDMLGLFADFVPKHAKRYAQLTDIISEAVNRYKVEVSEGSFPGREQSFSMDERLLAGLPSAPTNAERTAVPQEAARPA
jgi:3-methyl-2-oxobutanoate hydroxymethyltransferase